MYKYTVPVTYMCVFVYIIYIYIYIDIYTFVIWFHYKGQQMCLFQTD